MAMVTATGVATVITTAGTMAGVTGADVTGIGTTTTDNAGMILVYC